MIKSGITRDRISAVCTRGEQPPVVWATGGVGGAGELNWQRKFGMPSKKPFAAATSCFLVDAKNGLSPSIRTRANAAQITETGRPCHKQD
jgi:predicted GTPase